MGSKATRLREALAAAGKAGINSDELAEKANIRGAALKGVLYPFLARGEVDVRENTDGPDIYVLNTDYVPGNRKGGASPRAKVKRKGAARKAAKAVKRAVKRRRKTPTPMAELAARVAAVPNGNGLALRHVATTFSILDSLLHPIDPQLQAALQAHREALELAQQHH